jgi:hypothetical protein
MKIFEGMNAGKQRFSPDLAGPGPAARPFQRTGRRHAAAAAAPYHRPHACPAEYMPLRRASFSPALSTGTLIFRQNGLQRLSKKRQQLLIK